MAGAVERRGLARPGAQGVPRLGHGERCRGMALRRHGSHRRGRSTRRRAGGAGADAQCRQSSAGGCARGVPCVFAAALGPRAMDPRRARRRHNWRGLSAARVLPALARPLQRCHGRQRRNRGRGRRRRRLTAGQSGPADRDERDGQRASDRGRGWGREGRSRGPRLRAGIAQSGGRPGLAGRDPVPERRSRCSRSESPRHRAFSRYHGGAKLRLSRARWRPGQGACRGHRRRRVLARADARHDANSARIQIVRAWPAAAPDASGLALLQVIAGDFDGDGVEDLAYTRTLDGAVLVRLGVPARR
jgi:hypothetical protein